MRAWLTVTGTCSVLCACSVFGEDPTESATDAVARGQGVPVRDAAVASEGNLTVSLRFADQVSCRDQDTCSAVSAEVSGGVPPYDYVWSVAGLVGPGPHTICTRDGDGFSLAVSDAQRGAEFGEPNTGRVAFTIVGDACREPPEPNPAPARAAACASLTLPLDYQPGNVSYMLGAADVDDLGNLYVAGTVVGAVTLAPGVRADSRERYDVGTRPLLAKYDSACNLVWWRWLGGEDRPVDIGSLDVDRDGQVALSTSAFGSAYGNGGGGVSTAEVTLFSVAPDGEISWNIASRHPQHVHGSNGGHGVQWGPDGSVGVYGLGDLCLAQDGEGPDGVLCVARIARDGRPLFARWIADAYGASVALDAQGALVAAGLSLTGAIRVNGLPAPPPERAIAYAVKFDPAGTPLWLRTLGDALPRESNWIQSFVHLTPDGVVRSAWYGVGDASAGPGVNVWSIAADGTPLGDSVFSAGTGSSGNVTLAGMPNGDVATGTYGSLPVPTEQGESTGAVVTRWSPAGELEHFTFEPFGEQEAYLHSLHVSPAGRYVLVTEARVNDGMGTSTPTVYVSVR